MSQNPSRRGRFAGFTLVELVVTLSVAAILAALTVPSFKWLIAQSEMRSVSTALSLTMTRARSEATKRFATVTVNKKGGNWKAGWQVRGPGGDVLLDQAAIKGVAFDAAPSGDLSYASSGRVRGNPTPQFALRSESIGSIKRCVSVDASGGASIRDGECS